MKISIFKNLTSVRPFTSWSSRADMANFLEENQEIAAICKKIAESGNKELKSGLPLMMPMGDIGDLKRSKENAEPTGLVMIDIDKAPSDSPKGEESPAECCEAFMKEVKAHFEGMKAELERQHVVLVHVTPSGMGLRLLVHCHAEGFQATIDDCVEALGLERFGKVDPACKDLSRLSYLVPMEYIVYEKGLFEEVPQVSLEEMRKYKSTGTVVAHANVGVTLGEVEENDAHYAGFEYNGFKLADIVRDYIAETGGDPVEGTRHTFYNEMVVLFRNLANNEPKVLHAVLPSFGLPLEETWKQCVSLTGSNRQTRMKGRLYYWLKEKGLLAERKRVEKEQEVQEEPLPPMPKLPPVFKQYVGSAPEDFKIPTVVALLPILGTLTSHLRATYFDDTEQSTEFISLLFAPPSSGKSFIKRLSKLLQNLRDRDALANAREELYAMSERRKGANEKGEEAPRVSVRIVKPLISVPELLTKMRNNQGHHMFIEAEELDTFSKGNKTAGGDKSDLWRVTWDNGYYGQYYKSVNTFKGEVQMFMNLLFTGTQDQIDRFFKNVEDGLVTRFSVCPIENQTFAKFVPWKKMTKGEELQIRNILNRLEMKNYKMPLRFDKSELLDVKGEEFDSVVPWQYEFQPLEHVDLSYIYPTLQEWLERERIKAAETLNEARDVFRRRTAVKGFRLALLCHGLYTNVGKKEKQVITEFVKWFCTVDLRNSLYQFGQRYNDLQERVKKPAILHHTIFERMPETFTKTELRQALLRDAIKSPVKAVIYLWHKNHLVRKTGENGDVYVKCKRA